jgi:hypothetical protein
MRMSAHGGGSGGREHGRDASVAERRSGISTRVPVAGRGAVAHARKRRMSCAAILFLDEAADFLFWIKEWWGEQS